MIKGGLLLVAGCVVAAVLVVVYWLPHTYVTSVVSELSGGNTATPTPSALLFTPPPLPTGLPTPVGGTPGCPANDTPNGGGGSLFCPGGGGITPGPSASPSPAPQGKVLVAVLAWSAEDCRYAWGYMGADAQDDHDTAVSAQARGDTATAAFYATYSGYWVALEGVASELCGRAGPWLVDSGIVYQGIGWMTEARDGHLAYEEVHGQDTWDSEWAGIYDRLVRLFNELPGGASPRG